MIQYSNFVDYYALVLNVFNQKNIYIKNYKPISELQFS